MSSCEIVYFKDNKPYDVAEFRNSWGGAAYIWDAVYREYVAGPGAPHGSWLSGVLRYPREFWDLSRRRDIPLFVRAVHASTFDFALIRREHFTQFVEHLRQFVTRFPPEPNVVCHLPAWAETIEQADAEVEAIGFYGTSVSENLWYAWDEERDESVPYDLSTGINHFEIYEWVQEKTA